MFVSTDHDGHVTLAPPLLGTGNVVFTENLAGQINSAPFPSPVLPPSPSLPSPPLLP